MFMTTVVGAIIYGIGVYIVNRHGSGSLGLERFVDQGGFAFAYLIVAAVGAYTTWRLLQDRDAKLPQARTLLELDGEVDA
jgi:uncharacterized membrane protein YiaA